MDPELPTATGTRTAVLAAIALLAGGLLVAGGASADEHGLDAKLDPPRVAPQLVTPEDPLTLHVDVEASESKDLANVSITSPIGFELAGDQPDPPDGYTAEHGTDSEGRALANFTRQLTDLDPRSPFAEDQESFPLRFQAVDDAGSGMRTWRVLAQDFDEDSQPLEDNPRIYVDPHPPVITTSKITSELAQGWTAASEIEYARAVGEICPPPETFPPGCPVTKVLSIQDPNGDEHPLDVTNDPHSQSEQRSPITLPSGTNGTYTFTLTATDAAGLTDVGPQHTVKLDRQAPGTTIEIDPVDPTGQAGWYDEAPNVTLACADPAPASGCQTTTYTLDGTESSYDGTPIQLTEPGTRTLTARSTDAVGNQGPSAHATVKVDTTAPNHTIELDDPQGDGDWFTSVPTVELTCQDGPDESGCQTLRYQRDGNPDWQPYEGPFEITAEGVHEIETEALDEAGNAQTSNATVRFDATDPTVAIQTPTAGALLAGPNLTLTHSAADAHLVETVCRLDDGPARTCTGSSTINFTNVSEGPHDVTVTARDRAGHTTALARTVDVDRTPPTIVALSAPENLTTGSTLTAQVEASDAIGLVSLEFLHDGQSLSNRSLELAQSGNLSLETTVDTVGNRTYTVQATDGVGRTTERSFTVEVLAPPPEDDEPDDADGDQPPDRDRSIPRTLNLLDRDDEDDTDQSTTTEGTSDGDASPEPVALEASDTGSGGEGILEARVDPQGGQMPTVTSSQLGLSLDLELASPAPARVRLSPGQTPSPDQPEIPLPTLERFDLSVDPAEDAPIEIEQAQLGFSLPASTFEDPGSSPDDVVVFHWTGTYWERLPVGHEGIEGDEHRFSAITSSFSPFTIALDTEATSAPLQVTAVPGQDASTYRASFDLVRADRSVRVTAMDGTFGFQLEALDADTYDLEVIRGDSLPGAPATSTTVAEALSIDLRSADGTALLPSVTDLEIQVPRTGQATDVPAERIVTARAANGSWVPVVSTSRSGDPLVTASSTPGSAHFYGALIDTTDPRIALPDDDPQREDGTLVFRPVASDDLSIGAVQVDAGGQGLAIDDERPFELAVDRDAIADGRSLTFTATDAAGNQASVDWQPASIDEPLEQTTSDPEPSQESQGDEDTGSGGSVLQEAWVWVTLAVLAAVGVAAAVVKLR